ncbi:DUF1841 family protein [Pseudonocardia hierapolitana]|uniref:DUF1841 family protein n=1 Tax=Pseudonocardia hierapolitana TaxID=1128676 RepID=UPI0011BEE7C6|nr:DUF1841 family protein [Pseudonocardia hierapolitana]
MSPQSKGRKRKTSGARRRNEPQGPDAVIAQICRTAVRDVESASDALEAELHASGLLGVWWGKYLIDADPEVVFGEPLIAYAGRNRRSGAVGLLRLIAVLGTDRQREQAAAAADALVESGVREPGWVRELGTEQVTEAWRYGDVFGDQTGVLLVVERAGARHGVVALVDHTLDGIVKDVFVTDEPDAVLADIREIDDAVTHVRGITPEEAGAVLVPAFAMTDRLAGADLEPPVDEEFGPSRALAVARVRLLPAPAPAPAPAPLDATARTAVVDEFLGSEEAHDLQPAARGCAELLVEFGSAVDPARPLRVGPGLVDRFLDETLNDGPEISDDEFEALPATVRAWASWAGRRAELPEAAMAVLLDEVDDMVCSIGRPSDPEAVPSDVADAYLAGLDLDDVQPEDLPDVLERRMFAVPAVGTRIGDEEFPFLDPSDPDDRGMLIEGEHPEYHEALAEPESDTVDGVSPRLHITVHEIVANQLWDDDPPEVWRSAKRLSATGMDRHDVLHAIGEVLVEHLHGALTGSGPSDPARYVEQIDILGRTGKARVVPLRRKR